MHLLKAHVDHGFALIKYDLKIPDADDTTSKRPSEDDCVEYLVELTRAGLEQRSREAAPQIETTPAYGRFAQFANRLRGKRPPGERRI